jgi:Universal stress protein family
VTTSGAGGFERGTDGPRVLLVGVDGSPTSLRAAAYAAGLARRQQARLVAVYVTAPVSPLEVQLPDGGALERAGRTQLAAELEAEVATAAARIGIAIEYLVRHGDPPPSSRGWPTSCPPTPCSSVRRSAGCTGWWAPSRRGWCGEGGGRSPSCRSGRRPARPHPGGGSRSGPVAVRSGRGPGAPAVSRRSDRPR